MAFPTNVLPQTKSFIPLSSPFINLRNPKFMHRSLNLPQHIRTHKRFSVSISAVASDVEVQEKLSNSISNIPGWKEFAKNVSGEWDGFGADFTSKGEPIELPENVVPEAYREWEVKVFDWQTQCPSLAEPEKPVLAYKVIKLLPTVGCEADAATRHSIDERSVGGLDSKVSAFAYHASGCYVAVWPKENNGEFRLLELEHCLVDPQNRESRVRIVQEVRVENTVMTLRNIKVFREQWYGPFRNGESLGGCAIRDSGFASTGAMKGSEVAGVWEGYEFVTKIQSSQTNIVQELIDEKPQKSERDDQVLVLLPKQLWCSLKEREDSGTCGEVGWLLGGGRAITSRCIFSKDGKLQEIALGLENTTFEGI